MDFFEYINIYIYIKIEREQNMSFEEVKEVGVPKNKETLLKKSKFCGGYVG